MADEQVAPSASQTTCRHSSPLRICVTCQKPKYARFSLKKREAGASSRTARIFKRRNTCFSEGAAQYCCPAGVPPPRASLPCSLPMNLFLPLKVCGNPPSGQSTGAAG